MNGRSFSGTLNAVVSHISQSLASRGSAIAPGGTPETARGKSPSHRNGPLGNLPRSRGVPASTQPANRPPELDIFEAAIHSRLKDGASKGSAPPEDPELLSNALQRRLASLESPQASAGTGYPAIARNTEHSTTAADEFVLKIQNAGGKWTDELRSKEEIELHILLESYFRAATPPDDSPKGYAIDLADLHAGAGVQAAPHRGTTPLHESSSAGDANPSAKPAPPTSARRQRAATGPTATAKAQSPMRSDFDPHATLDAVNRIAQYCLGKPLDAPMTPYPTEIDNSDESGAKSETGSETLGSPHSGTSNEFKTVESPVVAAKIDTERRQVALRSKSNAWREWLKKEGIVRIENSKSGNNCLLMSLLQHASGNYDATAMEEHRTTAQKLRADMLAKEFGGIEANNYLLPESDGVKWAIKQINLLYGRNLRLVTVQLAGDHNTKNGFTPVIAHDADCGTEPVAVFAAGDHFEALIATKR